MNDAHPTLPASAIAALDQGHLVEAIKLLRSSGMEPKAIKEAVDNYIRNAPSRFIKRNEGEAAEAGQPLKINVPADTLKGLSPGQVPASSAGHWVTVALVIATVVGYIVFRRMG